MNKHATFGFFVVGMSVAWVAWSQAPPPATLTLHRAAELALEHAPGVALAASVAREQRASASLASDELRPQAWLSATPGYGQGLPAAIAGTLPAVAGLTWHQTLYDRASSAEASQRHAQELSAQARLERAKVEAVRSVLLYYASCWEGTAMVAAARQKQHATERILEQAEAARAADRITDLELEQARLRVAKARMHALDLEAARDLDDLELRRLIGSPTETNLLLSEDPLAALRDVGGGDDLQAARASDPELSESGKVVEALDEAVALQPGPLTPVIQAEAAYFRLYGSSQYLEFYRSFQPDAWSVGISFTLPLWSGGRRADARARAEASLARAVTERLSRDATLTVLVRRAESALQRAHAQVALAREASGVAEEALRVARATAAEGRGSPDAIEIREVELADAQEDAARQELSLFVARVDLLALRGELTEAAETAAAPSPPGLDQIADNVP
jgi:outer membrane protein